MYDLIIIGGGPAGLTAGIYSARKKIKTLLLADKLGGQSEVAPEIQNWIGEISISGVDLAKKMEEHLRYYAGDNLVIKEKDKVTKIIKENGLVTVTTDKDTYQAKTLLATTGATRRKLDTEGADTFEHKGVTYCASCDGPMFADQDVVVIGGGNAGFGSASQLLAYCKSVTLLEMAPTFKAEQITIEKLQQNPKFKALANVELIEIKGDPSKTAGQANFVASLVYKNKETGETIDLPTTGIFIEIGFLPNTEIFKDLVKIERGAIVVDHQTQATSEAQIWAAGDCANGLYHQNNIAVGDAVKAVEDIYIYLQKN